MRTQCLSNNTYTHHCYQQWSCAHYSTPHTLWTRLRLQSWLMPQSTHRLRNDLKCVEWAGLWSRSRRLSLETVSRRTNISSRSRLEKNCQRLGLGRQTSRSRPITSRAQDQFSAKLCRPH